MDTGFNRWVNNKLGAALKKVTGLSNKHIAQDAGS